MRAPTLVRRLLHAMRDAILSTGRFMQCILHLPRSSRGQSQPLQTEDITIPDDEFMDAMLAKISLKGEETLSDLEKKRMIEISKKRRSTNV